MRGALQHKQFGHDINLGEQRAEEVTKRRLRAALAVAQFAKKCAAAVLEIVEGAEALNVYCEEEVTQLDGTLLAGGRVDTRQGVQEVALLQARRQNLDDRGITIAARIKHHS